MAAIIWTFGAQKKGFAVDKTKRTFSPDTRGPELAADVTWFHVFRSMIEGGDVAAMGPHAFTVYAVVKAHTHFSSGAAFPSVDTIAEKAGVSVRQVKRELKTLQALGYLGVRKVGRANHYALREKVEVMDSAGRPAAVATWDYLPAGVGAAVAELKHVLMSGDLGGARVVNIERLTVNVAAAGGVVVNVEAARMPDELRQKLADFAASIGASAAPVRRKREAE
jgi:predicted DNA-binding protein